MSANGGAPRETRNDIAIIGMAGRFPRARNIEVFWENLCAGVEGTSRITADDLRAIGVDPAVLADPDYVSEVFALDEAEHFDADLFGMSPREAESMDPQQRLLLETSWAALEHAGYDSRRYPGLVGVFGGVGRNSYFLRALRMRPELLDTAGEYLTMIGNERDFPTTQVSYRLDLRGPSVDVQSACSTSGVAAHLARLSLLAGDCDIALAGGCKVIVPNREGYRFVDGGPLAPEGHVRAFDAGANGMVRGSGAAMLVLKRLEDALADGDTIYAVMIGSAVNNDGAFKAGFTAPSVAGQAAVIADALATAHVSASTIGYVETHGTGTVLGDPIEVAGLTEAFRQSTDRREFCAIGSVKPNIGHLDAAATVAGLVKTVLALRHERIPPSINFHRPNPHIDFATSPFFVNAELRPWPRGDAPRRAGVSSFGLGGTNAHIVLEEAPREVHSGRVRSHELLLLSARSEPAIREASIEMAEHLRRHAGQSIADVAHTLQVGRREFSHRWALVCREHADAADALSHRDAARVMSGAVDGAPVSLVYMFPGGGAQYPGMAAGVQLNEPVFRGSMEECAALLGDTAGDAMRAFLERSPGDTGRDGAELERPSVALPALFAVEYSLARTWISWGLAPAAMIGHSLGEYAAACIAGVFSLADALKLVACRGRLFETLRPGGMLSVPLGEAELLPLLGSDLSIAAINKPGQCVASGEHASIDALAGRLAALGIESTRIHISVAAHSSLVDPILDEFGAVAAGIRYSAPAIPFISNVTGTWITAADATDPAYWVRHLRQGVRFADGLATLYDDPSRVLLEVGPGQTLSTFARSHPSRRADQAVISSVRHPHEAVDDEAFLLQALGRLWVAGLPVDWAAFRGAERRKRVGLPTYAFQRKKYSLADRAPASEPAGAAATVDAAHSSPASPATRFDRIVVELLETIHALSGMEPARISPDSTFLELGFDSLFLAQANNAFKKRFAVKLTTRHLLEKTPTINSLARHLDAEMPAGAMAGERPLSGGATQVAQPAQAVEPMASAVPDKTSPWQPVARSAPDAALSTAQQAHLDALIAQALRRTPRSKAITQENRAYLADPRTVQGFRKQWKEIVYPLVSERAKGSRIWDVDGNEYIDLVNGYGVTFFGHSPDFIVDAVRAELDRTIAIGPQTPLAGEVAKLVCELTGMERAAFCNTGSEAVLAAIRVARTVTGRTKLATFAGHYHGIFDEVLVKGAGTGAERRPVPIAPGIPPSKVADVIVMEYDNLESLDVIRRHADDIALVLVEPVRSRNLDRQPVQFLRALRKLTEELGIPLLFDEMITGFRSHPGGAQALFGVRADIATYGKVIGGEFPIGVVAGRKEYLDALDGGMWSYGDDSTPDADMTWFAGTFVRHPIALAAAKAALTRLKEEGPGLQSGLNDRTHGFVRELNEHFRATNAPIHLEQFSSLFIVTFTSYQEYSALLFYHLRNRGVFTYEGRPAFFTLAHTDADMAAIATAFKESVAELQQVGFLSGGLAPPELASRRIPLTEGQQEIWLATRLGDDASRAFNLASTLRLRGPLDVEALRRATRQLVRRHESLRAVPEEDGIHQRIEASFELDVPLVDLAVLDARRREARLAELKDAEVETPFDLINGPLVRAKLLKLAEEDHFFVITVHHMICDGWSCGVLLRDLVKLYDAERTGRAADLRPAMQLGEFVQLSADNRASPERADAEAYWVGEYAASIPVLELPTDRPRPPKKTFRAKRIAREVDPAFVDRMKRLSAAQGSTLFTTMLAGFAALLHRLSGQDDLVIGFSLAGQAAITDRDLVGHCVTFLPLRLRAAGETPFGAFVHSARGKVLDALEHQNLAFGGLIQKLRMRRDPGRVPLMSVAFNLDPSGRGLELDGMSVESGSVPRKYENFDIFMNLVELKGDRLDIQCTFNLDLFDESTMRRHLAAYTALLDETARAPDTTLGELTMPHAQAADAERREPLHLRFERQAALTPDAVAVTSGLVSLTYRELDARANRLAHALRATGVGPETLVGLLLDRSVEMVTAALGILKAGGAYVPADVSNPPERVRAIFSDAAVPIVVTRSSLAGMVPPSVRNIIRMDADSGVLAAQPATPVSPLSAAGDAAYVIYTSGSTGAPKGVVVTHENVTRLFDATRPWFAFGASDVWTLFHSIAFDVSVWEMWGALLHGGRLVVVPQEVTRSPDRFRELLLSEGVTVLNQTPSAFRAFMQYDASQPAMGIVPLRYVIFAGEALDPASLRPWVERYGDCAPQLVNMYGITETTVHVTYRRIRREDIEPGARSMIGVPIPDLRVYLLDEAREPVPQGEAGEIYVGGPGVARGYLNRPELTAQRFVADPFGDGEGARMYRSGDLARQHANGDLEYLGRLDSQVKIRGFRVETSEVASVLRQAQGVADAAVVASELVPGEKSLVAYVVPRSPAPADARLADAVREFARSRLPDYMMPAAVVVMRALPLTSNGKLDVRALPPPDREHFASDDGSFVAPAGEIESAIAAVWRDVLHLERIGARDNFFELGGHSLLGVQVMMRLREQLGVELSLGTLFEAQSIEQIARRIEALRFVQGAHAPVPGSEVEEVEI